MKEETLRKLMEKPLVQKIVAPFAVVAGVSMILFTVAIVEGPSWFGYRFVGGRWIKRTK